MDFRIAARIVLFIASLPALVRPSTASDWYVDPVQGSDANSGTSPMAAWRTITHALSVIPAGATVETVHLAPGAYSASGGEVFPLPLRSGQELVGDAGAGSTVIDGTGFPIELAEVAQSTPPNGLSARLTGLTLQNAGTGVSLTGFNLGYLRMELDDLLVTGMSVAGIWVDVVGGGDTTGSHPRVFLTGCELRDNQIGAHLRPTVYTVGSASVSLDARDCSILGNMAAGVEIGPVGTAAPALVRALIHFDRCRILNNGLVGVDAIVQNGLLNQRITDCFVAGNPFGILSRGTGGIRRVAVTRSTIVDSSFSGIESYGPASTSQLTLQDSIAWRNGDDLGVSGTVAVSGSDIEDGDYLGQNGNFSLDPLFRDPSGGDWRLRWGSPCIDRALIPALAEYDLEGTPRTIDGDLDTLGRPDLGCFEFRPLGGRGRAELGTDIGLELWGGSGATSQLLLSLARPTAGSSTPFGDFFLQPGYLDLGVHPAGGWPPSAIHRHIPPDPALIGTILTFQALTNSALAPQGAAYTNSVSFVIRP